jgi:hypothetical protein
MLARAKVEAHVRDGTKTAGKTWPGEVALVLGKHTWLRFPQYAFLINKQVGLEYQYSLFPSTLTSTSAPEASPEA